MPGGAAAAQKGTHVPSARLQSSTWKRDEVRAVQNGREEGGGAAAGGAGEKSSAGTLRPPKKQSRRGSKGAEQKPRCKRSRRATQQQPPFFFLVLLSVFLPATFLLEGFLLAPVPAVGAAGTGGVAPALNVLNAYGSGAPASGAAPG